MTPESSPAPEREPASEPADRLARLAAWAPVFAAPGFSPGAWEGGQRLPDGSIEVPYFTSSDDVDRFRRELSELGWVFPFDWPAWAQTPEAQRLLADPAAVAGAAEDDLGKLLTTFVRGDRFNEGALASAFERGMILAICRRAGELAAAR